MTLIPSSASSVSVSDEPLVAIDLIDPKVKKGELFLQPTICQNYIQGIKTQRDEWVYDISVSHLAMRMREFVAVYESERQRLQNLRTSHPQKKLLQSDLNTFIKWDRELCKYLNRDLAFEFDSAAIYKAAYRPFVHRYLYLSKHSVGMTYQWLEGYTALSNNRYLTFTAPQNFKPFHCLMTAQIPDLHFTGNSICIPLYRINENGKAVYNISDNAVDIFKRHYSQASIKVRSRGVKKLSQIIQEQKQKQEERLEQINKETIFYYCYAVLHYPAYLESNQKQLKNEYPKIKLYPDFWKFAEIGKQLADLHCNFEHEAPYDKAVLSKTNYNQAFSHTQIKASAEKQSLVLKYEKTEIKLEHLPTSLWTYRLGNKSVISWLIDQHKTRKMRYLPKKFQHYRINDYAQEWISLLLKVAQVAEKTQKCIEKL
ncbi:MAG: hypothetical protein JJT94_05875 [Bernardetiaceae bacterium]|nr:hypothetical protein [Bernardetiaceae bacterium]